MTARARSSGVKNHALVGLSGKKRLKEGYWSNGSSDDDRFIDAQEADRGNEGDCPSDDHQPVKIDRRKGYIWNWQSIAYHCHGSKVGV